MLRVITFTFRLVSSIWIQLNLGQIWFVVHQQNSALTFVATNWADSPERAPRSLLVDGKIKLGLKIQFFGFQTIKPDATKSFSYLVRFAFEAGDLAHWLFTYLRQDFRVLSTAWTCLVQTLSPPFPWCGPWHKLPGLSLVPSRLCNRTRPIPGLGSTESMG